MHLSAKVCPSCGEPFPPPQEKNRSLRDDDIMQMSTKQMDVGSWRWWLHTSQTSGKDMLKVTYYPKDISQKSVTEYLPITHEGFAGEKALRMLRVMAANAGVDPFEQTTIDGVARVMTDANPPSWLYYQKDGKFHRVIERFWDARYTE